jgi:hypothetical protein
MEKKFLQTAVLGTNKTLIRNSLYVFENWGKNLSCKRSNTIAVRKCYQKGQADPDKCSCTCITKVSVSLFV